MNNINHISAATYYSKYLTDIIFSCIGLLLTLPLFPLIALAIKFNSRGPVFFQQPRIGEATPDHAVIFKMIKFRTMKNDAEKKSGAIWASTKDPRVTTIGSFLRKTRLDELPQFINVLRGEMSIIGPRPERPGFYQELERNIPFFAERTYGVKPGITGLAQVTQGYDTCIDDVRNKVALDHSYGLALSSFTSWVRMDFNITIKTLITMLMGRGK